MTENEINRAAHALNELRPDWPISSLTTWLRRNMSARPYRDAMIALVWVALDAKPDGTYVSDRPARVLEPGPWWRAAAIGDASLGHPHPPTRDEQCRRCGGRLPDCACQREHLAATYDDDPAPTPTRIDRGAALAAARDAIRAAKVRPEIESEAAS
jgi:hypothetical protein